MHDLAHIMGVARILATCSAPPVIPCQCVSVFFPIYFHDDIIVIYKYSPATTSPSNMSNAFALAISYTGAEISSILSWGFAVQLQQLFGIKLQCHSDQRKQ